MARILRRSWPKTAAPQFSPTAMFVFIAVGALVLVTGFAVYVLWFLTSPSASKEEMSEELHAIVLADATVTDEDYHLGSCFDVCSNANITAQLPTATTLDVVCDDLLKAGHAHGTVMAFTCETAGRTEPDVVLEWEDHHRVTIDVVVDTPKIEESQSLPAPSEVTVTGYTARLTVNSR